MEEFVVGGLGDRVKWYLFQGNRGTISATFDGNRPTKNTGDHRTPGNQIFDLGNKQIYFTGPCTPTPPPVRALMVSG